MPTTRTPIGRPPRGLHITPKAIEAFGRMRNLDQLCTCDPIDWDGAYWKHELCPACEAWWEHHSILWNELSLKPWQWPAIETPGAVTCYPEAALPRRPGSPISKRRPVTAPSKLPPSMRKRHDFPATIAACISSDSYLTRFGKRSVR